VRQTRARCVARGERQRWGAELAWLVGPFGLRAEYITDQSDLERTTGAGALPARPVESRLDLDGWYVMGSYWLTGEDDLYNKRPQVKAPLAPWSEEGGWGAVEVAVRYSEAHFDEDVFTSGLADSRVSSSEVNQWAGGANWWFNPFTKLTVDFYHNHFDDGVILDGVRERDESLIVTRFQIDF